ncbi:MAG TPA: hypothetical protein VGK73_09055 [Polyangiaceae bacterium]
MQHPLDDGLEELGDEVIIAQETGAHPPQARAQGVTTDHPTVVISEEAQADSSRRGATVRSGRRERSEKTVVIRDRKKLDQMRRAISERHRKPRIEARTIYLLGAAGLASLALGTLIAAILDATAGATPPSTTVRVDPNGNVSVVPPATAPPAIDLDSLPDPPAKPRRADAVTQ